MYAWANSAPSILRFSAFVKYMYALNNSIRTCSFSHNVWRMRTRDIVVCLSVCLRVTTLVPALPLSTSFFNNRYMYIQGVVIRHKRHSYTVCMYVCMANSAPSVLHFSAFIISLFNCIHVHVYV